MKVITQVSKTWTQWGRVLLKKQIVAYMIKESPALYGKQIVVVQFTTPHS
jgi:hypothetical protein